VGRVTRTSQAGRKTTLSLIAWTSPHNVRDRPIHGATEITINKF